MGQDGEDQLESTRRKEPESRKRQGAIGRPPVTSLVMGNEGYGFALIGSRLVAFAVVVVVEHPRHYTR